MKRKRDAEATPLTRKILEIASDDDPAPRRGGNQSPADERFVVREAGMTRSYVV